MILAPLLAAATLILPPVSGSFNPAVTQATINKTICVKGWTATVRPPLSFTSPLKLQLMASQHLAGRASDYQLDHLVSLELGGNPTARRNLWMQPWPQARRDDHGVEDRLHRAVCAGLVPLKLGRQLEIAYKARYG